MIKPGSTATVAFGQEWGCLSQALMVLRATVSVDPGGKYFRHD